MGGLGAEDGRRFLRHPRTSGEFDGKGKDWHYGRREAVGPTANGAVARPVVHPRKNNLIQCHGQQACGHQDKGGDAEDLLCPHHVFRGGTLWIAPLGRAFVNFLRKAPASAVQLPPL